MNAANAHADTERRESVINLLLWEKRVAPLEHRAQVGPDGLCDHSMPSRVGMECVVEIKLVVPDDPNEKKRHERHLVTLSQSRVHAMKLNCIGESADRRRLHL